MGNRIYEMKTYKYSFFSFFAGSALFFSGSCFAQNQIPNTQPQEIKSPSTVFQNEDVPIVFKMIDEKGKEIKLMISLDKYKKIENKIKDYEKLKGIKDRTRNIYIINASYEVMYVTEEKTE